MQYIIIEMCGFQGACVAKVPSQFALSVMGREKLSIEILGHFSSNIRCNGHDGHPLSPSCLALTLNSLIHPWFTHVYPCTALLRLSNPAVYILPIFPSQTANPLQPKYSAQTVTPFSLDLASSGQGRSFGPASKTTWHCAQHQENRNGSTHNMEKRG